MTAGREDGPGALGARSTSAAQQAGAGAPTSTAGDVEVHPSGGELHHRSSAAAATAAAAAATTSELHARPASSELHQRPAGATAAAADAATDAAEQGIAPAAAALANGNGSASGKKLGGGSEAASEEEAPVVAATYGQIAKHFAVLGWTAFGGPAAHIAMFQKLFVDRLRWCTYVVFTELLMLGQCIPGAPPLGAAQRSAAPGSSCDWGARWQARRQHAAGPGTRRCSAAGVWPAGGAASSPRGPWLAPAAARTAPLLHCRPTHRWPTRVARRCPLVAARPLPSPALPAGPTSTQMGFAIGVLKKGLSGGLLSGVLFQVRPALRPLLCCCCCCCRSGGLARCLLHHAPLVPRCRSPCAPPPHTRCLPAAGPRRRDPGRSGLGGVKGTGRVHARLAQQRRRRAGGRRRRAHRQRRAGPRAQHLQGPHAAGSGWGAARGGPGPATLRGRHSRSARAARHSVPLFAWPAGTLPCHCSHQPAGAVHAGGCGGLLLAQALDLPRAHPHRRRRDDRGQAARRHPGGCCCQWMPAAQRALRRQGAPAWWQARRAAARARST